MAVVPTSGQHSRACPQCDGALVYGGGYWQCEDCAHVPRHAAD